MRKLATLSVAAVAFVTVLAFAGPVSADHKGFQHGVTSNNSGGGNSVDVTIACSFSGSTLTIASAVVDQTGDGETFDGTVKYTVECFEKLDGVGTFSSCSGPTSHDNAAVPSNFSDDFDGGLSFGGEDDLTGVVTVTGSTATPNSLGGRTLFATCDSDEII